MESRHDLGGVDHARLLSGASFVDPQAAGQMRPPYGDLCRPPGTDSSTLSAYHSRYLASMPLSAGSTFPFLSGMFTGSFPGPPTSPFRTPSTPGVNNMRQFWPPTPPPDGGYNRYSMNTNLFPLFGTPSPDSGAYLTQGLVSRLGATTHLSPLIDHKEHSFFSHGIGLGSPLTPTSHVAPPSPFPHLIPSLERHPAYGGHMTLGNKELEDLQHDADDSRMMKNHMDCIIKHDIPSSRQDRLKSKNDGKQCCDKVNDDCCKLSPSCIPDDNNKSYNNIRHISKVENKNQCRQPTNKVQPCKIEVSHSPALKPDLLSPPIESPKSDVLSPCRNSKKTPSPFMVDISSAPSSFSSFEENSQTHCSQCCANMKGIEVTAKLNMSDSNGSTESVVTSSSVESLKSQSPTVSSPNISETTTLTTGSNSSHPMSVSEDSHSSEKSTSNSPVISSADVNNKVSVEQSTCKLKGNAESTKPNTVAVKHVTAAVIPTAPKQAVHRDIHPEMILSAPIQELSKNNTEQTVLLNESTCSDSSVKLEMVESLADKTMPITNPSVKRTDQSVSPSSTSLSNKHVGKNLTTSCKVKDMIKNTYSAKPSGFDKTHDISQSKNTDLDACNKISNSVSPTKIVSPVMSIAVSPSLISKSPSKINKGQCVPLDNVNKCSPFKEVSAMKSETAVTRVDCDFSSKNCANWTKARVSPFNWQNNNTQQDDQAINLTVSKKLVKPEPHDISVPVQDLQQTGVKVTAENTVTNGVIGVCHPNPNPIALNKIKSAPAVNAISNFASISVLNQPTEQSTEVHILHRSSKSSFPVVNRNGTSPVPLKSTISHITANTSIQRSLKTERLTSKRGKISEIDKLNSGRTTLATLAPKVTKNINFGKDPQTSHTISASSSVSSTSIVFPATVNPCIPVGIAIAQQRQDSSTTTSIGKPQQSVPSTASNVISSGSHLMTSSRVSSEIQTQEIIREQKNPDLTCSNNPTPVDANLLVTQGPTIVSRQWESEALTRTALPSWVAHGSIVAPAVWLGQGAYTATAAPASNAVPSVAMNSLESSPISLPPGGYQLARDSITGHLLLIPTANIELMERTSVWPTFNSSTGNLPIQQLVTQQQHTQFEQMIPQSDSLKATDNLDTNCSITTCDLSSNTQVKSEEKVEDVSGQVPSVPLATGQTYAFTTFPTQCDPPGFSYVLQSSTVMHLAHTQTTASIQTESGRRSQATSPLHCATPTPPPNTCSVQVSVTEDEEESDNESDVACGEATQVQASYQSQSVTTAIQVDMDSQTNSEEDEDEERKPTSEKPAAKIEMSDSANQTESVSSASPKSEPENDDVEMHGHPEPDVKEGENTSASSQTDQNSSSVPTIRIGESQVKPRLEIVTSETELAPSLPVESKPVMDFIDHHGLNLLVDSIEEFASREQEVNATEDAKENPTSTSSFTLSTTSNADVSEIKVSEVVKKEIANDTSQKSYSPPYKTIDTTCTDGLGLLCALAEQRFFEEAMNDDNKKPTKELSDCYTFDEESQSNATSAGSAFIKENSQISISSHSTPQSSLSSSPDRREMTEMEMRLQIEELQKKYKQKQRELELLRSRKDKENLDEDSYSSASPKPKQAVPSLKISPKSPALNDQSLVSDKNEVAVHYESKSPRVPTDNLADLTENCVDRKSNDENSSLPNSDLKMANSCDSNPTNSLDKTPKHTVAVNENSESECISEKKVEEQFGQDFDKNDKSKAPIFDEQAWFVRRSERIFLSDARTVASTPTCTGDKNSKKNATNSHKITDTPKEKKENTPKHKGPKTSEENEVKKNKAKICNKPKTAMPKKRSLSTSSDSSSSSDENDSDVESSDGTSSTSENLPLSAFVDQSATKVLVSDRHKRMSTDSEFSSGQSEDIPLSVLIEQSIPELKSCILKPEDLQENARLLVLDEGLFYAGYITKSEDLDMYGILIDGDRAARPHMFSKEEILNAAVLEVKPTHKQQLPEGSRICAFWSQQYRCLYPGTVTKASSPLPDPSLLYVEFDDGDSGRIPLNDIRMLPSDFPIVSMEPNPFMILGKRRSRAQSQNSSNMSGDSKTTESISLKGDKDNKEHKKHKNHDKPIKKNHIDGKIHKDKAKMKLASNTSHPSSSSKSAVNGHCDSKSQSSSIKREASEESKKKHELKIKHSEKKPKDDTTSDSSVLKPKKHKKHKDEHHKHHHHHHHKHHHHKKHKSDKSERVHSSDQSVISSGKSSSSKDTSNCFSTMKVDQEHDTFILENSKSELTVKIKKSPSPHTNHEENGTTSAVSNSKRKIAVEDSSSSSSSSDEESVSLEPPCKKAKKPKNTQNKPAKRKDRMPSVEKSKIAAFLPVRQLWRWSGKSFRRPGAKGKAKKEFYRAIQRGKETIRVGDCAVFLSTGRPHLPYIGRIETMWESWGGKMDVKVKWFYHPEETKNGKKLSQLKGALFQSPHFDENDVQTISHKCEVLSWDEYQQRTHPDSLEDNNDTYFLAGTYDPIMGTLILEPGVPNLSLTNYSEP